MTEDLRGKIVEHIRKGNYESSIDLLQRELSIIPEDVEAKMMLGVCHQMAGDGAECLKIYDEVRPQMELREASGERSDVVSFWRRYSKLVAAVFAIGVIPFCVVGSETNEIGRVKIEQQVCNCGTTNSAYVATNEVNSAETQHDAEDCIQIFADGEGGLILRSRGIGTYDYNDNDEIKTATQEATLKAKMGILKFFQMHFKTVEEAQTAVKNAKTINSKDGAKPVAISSEAVEMAVKHFNDAPDRLSGISVVKQQKIPSDDNGGEVAVTVEWSTRNQLAIQLLKSRPQKCPAYGIPRLKDPPPKKPPLNKDRSDDFL